jgi:uncharacterized protein YqeY
MKAIEKLNEEIKNCMKSKNEVRLSVMRMLKNKILQVNARGEVTEEEATKLFRAYSKQLQETIDVARQNNKVEMYTEAEAELAIVKEFLPAELSPEQIKATITAVVNELGKDKTKFGLIMKESVKRLGGQADGAVVKNIVNELLA